MPRLSIFATVLILTPPAVFAQGAQVPFGGAQPDRTQPVEVAADSLQVNQNDGTALYSGNVVIGQGDMRLSAPKVLVVYDKENARIARMEATGGVTLVNGDEAAEAERADYDIDDGFIVMTGNVLLTQNGNALSSERVEVDLDTGTARMSGRVRTLLQTGGDN